MDCSLFTFRIRRDNATLFLSKIDDIITSVTPKLMQDLPMLIIFPVRFTIPSRSLKSLSDPVQIATRKFENHPSIQATKENISVNQDER